MKLGSIILYKNIPEFLSWVQRVVLNTIYSHLSIYIGKNDIDRHNEFEANIQVDQTTFRHDPEHQDIYELIEVPDEIIVKALNKLIDVSEEKIYGFGSWLTIFIRRCFEWLGFDAKGWKIWKVHGYHCTEVAWYLWNYIYEDWHGLGWDKFIWKLNRINPDTFNPKDVENLVNEFNNIIFRKV